MTAVHPVFTQHLLDHPEDAETRLIYADWLEDHGELREASLQRWLGAHGRWPYRREDFDIFTGWRPMLPWAWYQRWGSNRRDHAILPRKLFLLLPGALRGRCDLLYSTQRLALDGLAEALVLFARLDRRVTRSLF